MYIKFVVRLSVSSHSCEKVKEPSRSIGRSLASPHIRLQLSWFDCMLACFSSPPTNARDHIVVMEIDPLIKQVLGRGFRKLESNYVLLSSPNTSVVESGLGKVEQPTLNTLATNT